jgi:hypothetical protein
MVQPVEKVQGISSFYPWHAKFEWKWQRDRRYAHPLETFSTGWVML